MFWSTTPGRRIRILTAGVASGALVGGVVIYLNLRSRRRRKLHCTTIGQLNSASPILWSVDDGLHAPAQVRFVFADAKATHRLILCWVNDRGSLFHHYDFRGEHVECTFTGDAFVVFHHDGSSPQSVDDVKAENIVCSYRVHAPLDRFHEHVIKLQLADNRIVSSISTMPRPDDEYRVIVRHPGQHHLPPADKDWVVEYIYRCPPLPEATGYDSYHHTFYVWGDMDFDDYGAGALGRRRGLNPEAESRVVGLHPCKMNQIVPQTMTGRCLASNDDNYIPHWHEFDHWVIQAQYFWCTEKGVGTGDRALCGPAIPVDPGDRVHTTIRYSASSGEIDVRIYVESDAAPHAVVQNKESRISIPQPFPHDPTLFSTWREFFERCEAVDRSLRRDSTEIVGALGRPGLNIEYKGRVSVPALCSVCPFDVLLAAFPGCEDRTQEWRTELFCPRLGHIAFLEDTQGNGDESVVLDLLDAVILNGKKGGVMMERVALSRR